MPAIYKIFIMYGVLLLSLTCDGGRNSNTSFEPKQVGFVFADRLFCREYYIGTKIEPSFPLEPLQCANQSRAAYCSGWNISE